MEGFQHLTIHNRDYAYDHRENLLDDYCGLLAAAELYDATRKAAILQAARSRAESPTARLGKDENYTGWWRADDGGRPFSHPVDAGLPVVALVRYLELEDDPRRKAVAEEAGGNPSASRSSSCARPPTRSAMPGNT